MSLYNYTSWPNFSKTKLVCQHTGLENPNIEEFTFLMDKVQELRTWYGSPMYVTSAYRHKSHPIEAKKIKAGMHNKAAIDFRVPTKDCYKIIAKMFELGFTGIGINLTGDPSQRFIHGDFRPSAPRIWSY